MTIHLIAKLKDQLVQILALAQKFDAKWEKSNDLETTAATVIQIYIRC